MKIGEVIRKYRKEKQMTQEELADYLGITSSAVNKWENGYSLPDISLLAPIARVFGITTDTLLSYKEELTEAEIARIMEQFTEKAMAGDYDALFSWALGMLQEYPNCDELAINILPGLDGYKIILGVAETGTYDEYIQKAYRRLLKSPKSDVVKNAAVFLFHGYMNQKEYDEAEKILSYIPERESEHKMLRALLYRRRGESDAAYQAYERMILEGYEKINVAFTGIFELASDIGDVERRDLMIEKQEELARILEMGRYHEIYLRLYPALEQRDKETSIYLLQELVQGIRNARDYRKSKLYAHLYADADLKENDIRGTAFMLKQSFGRDDAIGFLRGNPRFEQIMRELEQLCGQE
ncbi:MAG: helix-turn-helix transcriptional regulator [Lachnospiraceae bacterium]|nr:helix-turn-helix transcriptional regulator [Lachnospiraceae bacterium]